jgi:mxaJ protein
MTNPKPSIAPAVALLVLIAAINFPRMLHSNAPDPPGPPELVAAPRAEAPARSAASEPGPMPRVRKLRVAADPNNLPFTNERREGFENKLAELLAKELGAELEYEWRAQRRGFFRIAFKEDECDVVLGVPADFDRSLTTAPYYRSAYCLVTRKDRKLGLKSLDDPALKTLKVGVTMLGADGCNTPPAHALAARGIIDNVVGFTVYGDYREESPPARIVEAVAKGDVDAALVWGPLAGYFAKRQKVELEITPLPDKDTETGLPFAFEIAVGVRRGQKALRDEIDAVLKRRSADVAKLLGEYGVPLVPAAREEGGR